MVYNKEKKTYSSRRYDVLSTKNIVIVSSVNKKKKSLPRVWIDANPHHIANGLVSVRSSQNHITQ